MGDYIEANGLSLTVYGQRQVSYSIDGVKGYDWFETVLRSVTRRAVSMEGEASAVNAATRLRMEKIDELGTALAAVAKAVADLSTESWDSDKKAGGLGNARAILQKYAVDSWDTIDGSGQITKGNAAKLQTKVQLAIDVESNALQQDASKLQNYISKRDTAYSQLSSLKEKFLRSRGMIVSNMRG